MARLTLALMISAQLHLAGTFAPSPRCAVVSQPRCAVVSQPPLSPVSQLQPPLSPLQPRACHARMALGGGGGLGGFFKQLIGSQTAEEIADPQKADDDFRQAPAEDLEYVPQVLVIGAAGRTGRIIVRKLVLQGFRVAVLVRSLSTETLNLLGSGVSYSYGDMTDYRTLLDAMEEVDRIVFAAEAEDEETELDGLQQVLRAFQDTRTFMYGDAEATKLTLLKMRKDSDFDRWRVEDTSEEIRFRLASAGVGRLKPSIAYWKRSPTAAHKNGIFVGRVFDTYLGSAAVSCSLSGLLVGGVPALSAAAQERQELQQQQQQQQLGAADGAAGAGVVGAGAPADAAADAAEEATAEANRAAAALAAREVPLDLGEYSGLLIRAIGDGNSYTAVIRTRDFAKDGLEYHADFKTPTTNFASIRLPFSKFVPVRGGRPQPGAPELDRHAVVGLALAFYPQRNNPAETTGEFYLSVSNIKTYRKRDEPEFVYISDAGVAGLPPLDAAPAAAPKPPGGDEEAEESAAEKTAAAAAAEAAAAASAAADAAAEALPAEERARRRRSATKQKGEAILRASGLTYFIARAAALDDRQSGMRRLAFTQGSTPASGDSVSRADIAEVATRSLLDPRACNVACTVSESQAAAATPAALGEQDISKALEVLEPNKI